MFIFTWLILSILVGVWASNKNVSVGGLGGFFISLLLSPLIGFIIVAISKPSESKILENEEMKKCPDCAELVKAEAKKCRFCGKIFDSEKDIKNLTEEQMKERQDIEENLKKINKNELQDEQSSTKSIILGIIGFVVVGIIIALIIFFTSH